MVVREYKRTGNLVPTYLSGILGWIPALPRPPPLR
jgi:hypothetical protein